MSRPGSASKIGRRVWKYRRIAKHAAAAARYFKVCHWRKLDSNRRFREGGHRRDEPLEIGFALDSSRERDGFEPSVPG